MEEAQTQRRKAISPLELFVTVVLEFLELTGSTAVHFSKTSLLNNGRAVHIIRIKS